MNWSNDYLKYWDRNSDSRVIANIGLAVSIAKKFFNRSRQSNDDIMQQAMWGLFMADKRFEESRGNKFSTYATRYISGYIMQLGRTKRDKKNDEAMRLHAKLDDDQPMVQSIEDEFDTRDFVEEIMTSLTKRERLVIELRFGLTQEGKMTLNEVGEKINLSRERVRQIEKDGLKKLRSSAQRKMLCGKQSDKVKVFW
jgi:RNA polymerase sporulation-specific sigma factor